VCKARRGAAWLGVVRPGMAGRGGAGQGKGFLTKEAWMRVHIELTGTTPLLMHNDRLSDPDDDYVKQIKEITDKKTNQTQQDKALVSKLEWYGGIYLNGSNEPIVPTANLVKCLRETATITKDGRRVTRGLSPLMLSSLLVYDGPKDLDKLYATATHVDRRQVKVGRARVKRTRPIFPVWALAADFELLTDVLNRDRLISIIELAGVATGLGDARVLGFGRFTAKVTTQK
jgi:hypothetical protein